VLIVSLLVSAEVIVTVEGARTAMEVSPEAPMDVPCRSCPVYKGAEHRQFVASAARTWVFRRLLEKAEEFARTHRSRSRGKQVQWAGRSH
jgi:hypothetical protein